jgi:glycosyltransferase involved in cell wall biosynthesis
LDYFSLPEFLKACDIAIDPKNSDTNQASGKMLNYMAVGLPIVCFDKANNRNYLGEGGYFCAEMASAEIAKGILHFAAQPDDAKKKGQLNKEKAVEFGWYKSGQAIEVIYKKLIIKK